MTKGNTATYCLVWRDWHWLYPGAACFCDCATAANVDVLSTWRVPPALWRLQQPQMHLPQPPQRTNDCYSLLWTSVVLSLVLLAYWRDVMHELFGMGATCPHPVGCLWVSFCVADSPAYPCQNHRRRNVACADWIPTEMANASASRHWSRAAPAMCLLYWWRSTRAWTSEMPLPLQFDLRFASNFTSLSIRIRCTFLYFFYSLIEIKIYQVKKK